MDNKQSIIEELCQVYADKEKIGFVLGAGVTKGSGVTDWKGLALKLFEKAHKEKLLKNASGNSIKLLKKQLQYWKNNERVDFEVGPEKILQFVSDHINSKNITNKLLKEVLFENLEKRSHNMVPARIYRENKTLDAIITFCAASNDSPVSSQLGKRSEFNTKVGAILTTNYDNLVEGSFNSKYGVQLFRPIAREFKNTKNKKIIPVYHMHGYISYVDDPENEDGVKASGLVLTEKDYYQTFYHLLGFSNMAAASFFRQFHSIFIGCSMTDRNVLRILYQLQKETNTLSKLNEHYAILPSNEKKKDDFEDELLRSYGVKSIRVNAEKIGEEIENILKQVYTSIKGVTKKHWLEANKGWQRK